ncbi:MAG: hypothetical protein JSW73_05075 [Candidatus Woesearchaeota archaeon]|nr:MAG: hypothetical protein JSW73_05075 [Candidatus Woesearchaeota archaeon]
MGENGIKGCSIGLLINEGVEQRHVAPGVGNKTQRLDDIVRKLFKAGEIRPEIVADRIIIRRSNGKTLCTFREYIGDSECGPEENYMDVQQEIVDNNNIPVSDISLPGDYEILTCLGQFIPYGVHRDREGVRIKESCKGCRFYK